MTQHDNPQILPMSEDASLQLTGSTLDAGQGLIMKTNYFYLEPTIRRFYTNFIGGTSVLLD